MQGGDSVTKKYIYLMLIPFLAITILAFTQKGKAPKKCQPNKNRMCLIAPDVWPAGFVGEPYSMELRVEGGRKPYTWRITGEGLPTGLVFTPGSGDTLVLSGPDRQSVVAFLERLSDQ